ncbi:MAG TPA: hypothetical protein VK829_15260 [Terriglobales bacterium]|nr:hypothetical protein [Terriglobales bacterium]
MQRILVLIAAAMTLGADSESFDHVTYLDHTIQLSRVYSDFPEYRNDPNNLPKALLPLVANLVRSAPVPKTFPTREAAQDALFKLMFPGYGYSMLGLHDPVALFSLEVPGAGEDRFILFTSSDGAWHRVDDFLWAESAGNIRRAAMKGDAILYYDSHDSVLRKARVAPNNHSREP